jgi:electron-transferring-flavoprotein dehydrogenase
MEGYGAKTMPLGGYYSVPKLSMAGLLLAGDTASLLNPMRLKGIHTAIQSGMLAAETVFQAMVSGDASAAALDSYDEAVRKSWIDRELRSSRNFHQGFENGLWMGLFHSGLQMLTGGRGIKDHMKASPGHARMKTIKSYYGSMREDPHIHEFDGEYTFDKLTDVYKSGTEHLEDQPAHLKIIDRDICSTRCTEEYGNPCERFCPANVYIWEKEADGGKGRVRIDFANCVHCKTCDIMDPYQVIRWTVPEGGGGPDYQKL